MLYLKSEFQELILSPLLFSFDMTFFGTPDTDRDLVCTCTYYVYNLDPLVCLNVYFKYQLENPT